MNIGQVRVKLISRTIPNQSSQSIHSLLLYALEGAPGICGGRSPLELHSFHSILEVKLKEWTIVLASSKGAYSTRGGISGSMAAEYISIEIPKNALSTRDTIFMKAIKRAKAKPNVVKNHHPTSSSNIITQHRFQAPTHTLERLYRSAMLWHFGFYTSIHLSTIIFCYNGH